MVPGWHRVFWTQSDCRRATLSVSQHRRRSYGADWVVATQLLSSGAGQCQAPHLRTKVFHCFLQVDLSGLTRDGPPDGSGSFRTPEKHTADLVGRCPLLLPYRSYGSGDLLRMNGYTERSALEQMETDSPPLSSREISALGCGRKLAVIVPRCTSDRTIGTETLAPRRIRKESQLPEGSLCTKEEPAAEIYPEDPWFGDLIIYDLAFPSKNLFLRVIHIWFSFHWIATEELHPGFLQFIRHRIIILNILYCMIILGHIKLELTTTANAQIINPCICIIKFLCDLPVRRTTKSIPWLGQKNVNKIKITKKQLCCKITSPNIIL